MTSTIDTLLSCTTIFIVSIRLNKTNSMANRNHTSDLTSPEKGQTYHIMHKENSQDILACQYSYVNLTNTIVFS